MNLFYTDQQKNYFNVKVKTNFLRCIQIMCKYEIQN